MRSLSACLTSLYKLEGSPFILVVDDRITSEDRCSLPACISMITPSATPAWRVRLFGPRFLPLSLRGFRRHLGRVSFHISNISSMSTCGNPDLPHRRAESAWVRCVVLLAASLCGSLADLIDVASLDHSRPELRIKLDLSAKNRAISIDASSVALLSARGRSVSRWEAVDTLGSYIRFVEALAIRCSVFSARSCRGTCPAPYAIINSRKARSCTVLSFNFLRR